MSKYFGQEKLVNDMVWSFSRYNSFTQCPRQWERMYILRDKSNLQNYYAQWGSICHQVLQEYFEGKIKRGNMSERFLDLYNATVMMPCPFNGEQKHIDAAMDFCASFEDIRDVNPDYEVFAVEKELHCSIDGWYWFKFIPDLLLVNKKSGGFIIVDHKSSDLKLGTKNKAINKKIDGYKEQLYIYSIGVEQLYNRPVENLFIDSIKGCRWLDLGFNGWEQEEAKKSFLDTVKKIAIEDKFECTPENFMCKNLCPYRINDCEHGYFEEQNLEG